MEQFTRRTYHGVREIIVDASAIMTRRKEIKTLMHGDLIDPAFRERLMLVVTGVNQCRYCSYAHARHALAAGISQEEITAYEQGMFDKAPAEQIPALLYAQHWAEYGGKPENQVRERVLEQYGRETLRSIELALRMIRMGNLLGNTADLVLYRISGGRLGV